MNTKNKQNKQSAPYWSRSHHSIFETFALELQDFTRTGQLPGYGDQDMNGSLELQKKRLNRRQLEMKYDFIPRGIFAEGGGMGRTWRDERYVSRMEYRTCRLVRTFFRNQKKVYEKKQDSIFYQIITNIYDAKAAEGDLFSCPNCGAVSSLGTLQHGCPYCGTFFKIGDFFPKVTNFFFIKDSGSTKEELNSSILNVILPCIAVSSIGYAVYFYCTSDVSGSMRFMFSVIRGILSGTLFGIIGGYILWAFMKIGSVMIEAGKSIPMLMNTAGSGKRFVALMNRYSPEFSYAYFSDKVVSILKMILYSEDAQELPNYAGGPLGNMFSDIVESSYTGAVALKGFHVQGDYCYVNVDAYMEDIYDSGTRIYSRREKIHMQLYKNIRKPIDLHFSLKKIQCRGCGGSFDATKQRTCPSCGKKYEIEDDDWVVKKIRKR